VKKSTREIQYTLSKMNFFNTKHFQHRRTMNHFRSAAFFAEMTLFQRSGFWQTCLGH